MALTKVNCYNCNKEIECETKHVNRSKRNGSNIYCSRSCQTEYNSKDIETKCVHCDKDITVRYSQHKKSKTGKHFCSRSCSATFHNLKRGSMKEQTKRKISYKLKGKTYNPRKCKLCGRPLKVCKETHERWICKKHQLYPTLNKYFGFDLSVVGSENVFEEFQRVYDLILEDYIDNHLSIEDMMTKYNYKSMNHRNFSKILESLNIDRRTLSECTRHNIAVGKIQIPKFGSYSNQQWYTTWNNKKVFLRSSLEIDYAKKLDKEKIDYDTESLRIRYWDSVKKCQRTAIPDFYIPSKNLIVEIKCDYTLDEQNMKDKVKAYKKHGYKFKLIVDGKEILL